MNTTAFAFGRNWLDFAASLTDKQVAESRASLLRLMGDVALKDKTFLDIGVGSGLHSLAARQSGARVTSFDVDEDSTACARALRARWYPDDPDWTVVHGSVLDAAFVKSLGTFDIVYSWGVLHHTGDMRRAIANASQAVAADGVFVIAIYRKTPLCGAWKVEKRFYSGAPEIVQKAIRGVFKLAFWAGLLATGRNPRNYVKNYHRARGANWHHDVHDWLGGHPYESANEAEIAALMRENGFALVRSNCRAPGLGLFGSGCDEYVARRTAR